ncbi:hypothetical protein GQX73_g2631 [Xylaria multiplex]|uniref:Mitochondrial fission process protein 1 n=1 Tax=Xylaria multiplex TaxID=323545 RepID=A0A7C8MW29_9PEZI|nr:hypothetical protein GQX73_g2631 [Xylaria multiplex]
MSNGRAVVEKTTSRIPILRALWTQAVYAASRPRCFLFSQPFAIVWTLYAATYTVASCSDTLGKRYYAAAASTATFLATTTINVPLGIWKDVRFAQIFSHDRTAGTISHVATHAQTTASSKLTVASSPASFVITPSPRRMPKVVAGVFLARDAMTLFGSITLAPKAATYIPDSLTPNTHAKTAVSQLTMPVLTQLVATPVHLLGLDLYQRQHRGVTVSNRLAHIAPELGGATFARCLRILPAFGLGVLANQELRSLLHTAARGI